MGVKRDGCRYRYSDSCPRLGVRNVHTKFQQDRPITHIIFQVERLLSSKTGLNMKMTVDPKTAFPLTNVIIDYFHMDDLMLPDVSETVVGVPCLPYPQKVCAGAPFILGLEASL